MLLLKFLINIKLSENLLKQPEFINLLNKLESGDKIIVTKLDRLRGNVVAIRNIP